VVRLLELGEERRVLVQRFACLGCGKSFSVREEPRRRYSEAFAGEIVRRHVEGESYRVIAREVFAQSGRKISPTSLSHVVQSLAVRCKSAWEISRERKPRWDGFLMLDEKMVSVRGKQQWFYGAFDMTGDVVHWRAAKELTVGETTAFLQEIKQLRYPCRGIVTDLDTALTRAVELEYTGKPHQYCLKHALGSLEELLGYNALMARRRQSQRKMRQEFEGLRDRKRLSLRRAEDRFLEQWQRSREQSENVRAISSLRDRCYAILFARSEAEAREGLKDLRRSRSMLRSRKWRAVSFLERHWDRLMMHHRVRGLPRTNNMAEGFNKQIQRRLKTIEGFQHRATAIAYMNLLVAYLRLKPYTDCRGARRHLNGRNRLQAAGLKHLPNDWLVTCLK
jgi:transposase-like protein